MKSEYNLYRAKTGNQACSTRKVLRNVLKEKGWKFRLGVPGLGSANLKRWVKENSTWQAAGDTAMQSLWKRSWGEKNKAKGDCNSQTRWPTVDYKLAFYHRILLTQSKYMSIWTPLEKMFHKYSDIAGAVTGTHLPCSARTAHHNTRSPPPPALQYGWKNATTKDFLALFPAFCDILFCGQVQNRMYSKIATRKNDKPVLMNNTG